MSDSSSQHMIEAHIAQPKKVWTTEDYDTMGWHHCVIYQISFHPEHKCIAFDIDYCFGTIPLDHGHFKQCTATCTLVFDNPWELSINLHQDGFPLEIQDLHLTRNSAYPSGATCYTVLIDTLWGEISFKSTGFTQTVTSELTIGCRDY